MTTETPTKEIPRHCPLCWARFVKRDLIYGHQCFFSLGTPLPRPPRRALAAAALYVGAVAAVVGVVLLGGLW